MTDIKRREFLAGLGTTLAASLAGAEELGNPSETTGTAKTTLMPIGGSKSTKVPLKKGEIPPHVLKSPAWRDAEPGLKAFLEENATAEKGKDSVMLYQGSYMGANYWISFSNCWKKIGDLLLLQPFSISSENLLGEPIEFDYTPEPGFGYQPDPQQMAKVRNQDERDRLQGIIAVQNEISWCLLTYPNAPPKEMLENGANINGRVTQEPVLAYNGYKGRNEIDEILKLNNRVVSPEKLPIYHVFGLPASTKELVQLKFTTGSPSKCASPMVWLGERYTHIGGFKAMYPSGDGMFGTETIHDLIWGGSKTLRSNYAQHQVEQLKKVITGNTKLGTFSQEGKTILTDLRKWMEGDITRIAALDPNDPALQLKERQSARSRGEK